MARKKEALDVAEAAPDEVLEEKDLDLEGGLDADEALDADEDLDVEDDLEPEGDDGEDAVPEEDDEEADEALDELEAEELELLADEAAESLLVDEAAELREIRRAELTMNVGAREARVDEFVCSSCFLVKRTSQLANKRKLICRDCA